LFTLNAPTAYFSAYALANISFVVTKGILDSSKKLHIFVLLYYSISAGKRQIKSGYRRDFFCADFFAVARVRVMRAYYIIVRVAPFRFFHAKKLKKFSKRVLTNGKMCAILLS